MLQMFALMRDGAALTLYIDPTTNAMRLVGVVERGEVRTIADQSISLKHLGEDPGLLDHDLGLLIYKLRYALDGPGGGTPAVTGNAPQPKTADEFTSPLAKALAPKRQ